MENLPLHIVDIGVIVILLISALLAFFRGAVVEILSLVGWGASLVIAYFVAPYVTPSMMNWVPNEDIASWLSFAAVTIVALITFAILNHYIAKTVKESPFESLDRSLGFLFGTLRGYIIVCLFYILYTVIYPSADPVQDFADATPPARTVALLDGGANIIRQILPDDLDPAKPESLSESAKRKTNEAIEQGEKILKDGQSIIETIDESTGAIRKQTAPSESEKEEGYNSKERQSINQLFENNAE